MENKTKKNLKRKEPEAETEINNIQHQTKKQKQKEKQKQKKQISDANKTKNNTLSSTATVQQQTTVNQATEKQQTKKVNKKKNQANKNIIKEPEVDVNTEVIQNIVNNKNFNNTEDDDGWTMVHSRQYTKAVGKTKQALNRIVGGASYQYSLSKIALAAQAEASIAATTTAPTRRPLLSGWGAWQENDQPEKKRGSHDDEDSDDEGDSTSFSRTIKNKNNNNQSVQSNSNNNNNNKQSEHEYEYIPKKATQETPMMSQGISSSQQGISLSQQATGTGTDKETQDLIIAALNAGLQNPYGYSDSAMVQPILRNHKIKVPTMEALGIFRQYLKQKVMLKVRKIPEYIPKVVELYDKQNLTIMQIAKLLDLPPVLAFRVLLIGRDLPVEKIELVMRANKKTKEYIHLNDRDAKQLNLARAADTITRELQDKRRVHAYDGSAVSTSSVARGLKASKFERHVARWLAALHVPFVTENQLREQGSTYATPDFVIKNGLEVDGTLVYWIDAKSFFGSDLDTTRVLIQNTVNKYTPLFGFGMVIFEMGFTQSLQNDLNVKLVSAKQLNLK